MQNFDEILDTCTCVCHKIPQSFIKVERKKMTQYLDTLMQVDKNTSFTKLISSSM